MLPPSRGINKLDKGYEYVDFSKIDLLYANPFFMFLYIF